jgi:dTDP-4-dehydrorhamnose reductase
MRVLVFGQTGQVARELAKRSAQFDITALGRAEADLTDPTACAKAVAESNADVVINAAAYTAVDKAEDEEALATCINAEAPGAMARACAGKAIPFLHISTDYVFDGQGESPWRPDNPTAPQNAYGRSKLAGENAVRAAGGAHVILRTSWVFSSHGNNFVKTMLRLAQTRDHLTVVDDQIGGPTAAGDIADALLKIASQMVQGAQGGTYHFSGAPDASWADFAREIFAQSGAATTVTGIPTTDYPTPAMRPLNSRMDCSATTRDFGITRPDWRQSLAQVLRDLNA